MIPGEILGGIAMPEKGAQRVRQQKTMGADFIKMVDGSRADVLEVLDEARQQGLSVSEHLPLSISAADASDASWRVMEHLGAPARGC